VTSGWFFLFTLMYLYLLEWTEVRYDIPQSVQPIFWPRYDKPETLPQKC